MYSYPKSIYILSFYTVKSVRVGQDGSSVITTNNWLGGLMICMAGLYQRPDCGFRKNKIAFDYPEIQLATSYTETSMFRPRDQDDILRVQTEINSWNDYNNWRVKLTFFQTNTSVLTKDIYLFERHILK